MQEWKAEKRYDFHKIKELPMESILEDSIVMPKFDGETTFLFFDPKMSKWVTCNNWGHYRTDYRVTEDAEKSILDKNQVYVGELIYGKNLYDFLRHKKDSEGLRLVIFEIFEDNPSKRTIKRTFEQRLKSIPLPIIYLEGTLGVSCDHLHLGKVPYYYSLKGEPKVLQAMLEELTKTYEGIVVRGKTSDWVMKIKKKRTLDVIVMGMQKKGKSWDKGELGSFLVGLYHEGKLLRVGTVGFPRPKERKALFKVIMDNKTSEDKYYVYVSPKMVMEIIAYDFIATTEYDTKKTFRSPIFQRWREDKPSTDCQLAHQFPEALE
jgi:ATP-dependent DNA ligase